MTTRQCSCETLSRLEGASVPAYVRAFLEEAEAKKGHYRCRVCGRRWEKRPAEKSGAGTRPSLVRVD